MALNVIATSILAFVPNTKALLNKLEIGPPSPAVEPSWVCPELALNALTNWLNSLLNKADVIVSPSLNELCLT